MNAFAKTTISIETAIETETAIRTTSEPVQSFPSVVPKAYTIMKL